MTTFFVLIMMQLSEAKEKFISSWSQLSTQWGISKTMAEIHALFLVVDQELCTDDVMDKLNISRGNANINIRELIEWGLIHKVDNKKGRKDYFVAEKDTIQMIKQIIKIRKRNELEPAIKSLNEIISLESKENENSDFVNLVKELEFFSIKADQLFEKLVNSDPKWLLESFFRVI